MSQTGPTVGAPEWMGDWGNRDSLVPGGAKVDAAQWVADANGKKPIPAGTAIGRTLVERDLSTPFGPAAVDGSDAEFFLVAFDVTDAADINDVELYRPGRLVKENFLPGFAGLAAALKAQIRAKYLCVRGAE